MEKKIIAFGSTGMVGYYLPKDIQTFDRKDGYDITDTQSLERAFALTEPTHVIHLAAVTDVVGAETNKANCYDVNTMATYHIARLCKKYHAKMYFISSVDVFNGEKKSSYNINDEKDPIVVYGHSKAAAEDMLLKEIPKDVCILRAGWMFGGFERDKKFVSYIVKQILSAQPVIKAVNDVTGTPTYGKDLIKHVMYCIENNITGIHHACCSGIATRKDEADLIVKNFPGCPCKVIGVSRTEFPKSRTLTNACLNPSFTVRTWQEALTEYITEWAERVDYGNY